MSLKNLQELLRPRILNNYSGFCIADSPTTDELKNAQPTTP